MVRNPFRPCLRRYRMPASVMAGWIRNMWKHIENSARLPLWSGEKDAARLRWAARYACKRLRTDNERLQQRLAEVERDRDRIADAQARLALELRTTHGRLEDAQHGEAVAVEQHAKERELRLVAEMERDEARGRADLAAHNGKVEYQRAEDYWKQLAAAKQENARLRSALQRIEDSDAALSNYGLYALAHKALAAGEERPPIQTCGECSNLTHRFRADADDLRAPGECWWGSCGGLPMTPHGFERGRRVDTLVSVAGVGGGPCPKFSQREEKPCPSFRIMKGRGDG